MKKDKKLVLTQETNDFDQRKFGAPICWSKYTTFNLQLLSGPFYFFIFSNTLQMERLKKGLQS